MRNSIRLCNSTIQMHEIFWSKTIHCAPHSLCARSMTPAFVKKRYPQKKKPKWAAAAAHEPFYHRFSYPRSTFPQNTMETFLLLILWWLLFVSHTILTIGDWNHKHKKSKTISSRVDAFKNLTEMDIFCFKSAAIIAVDQIFHLIDYFCPEIVKKIKLKFVRMPQSMKSSYLG